MIPRSLLVIGGTIFLASAAVALPLALVFLGVLRWGDDVLFFVFAEVMVVSGLLVVTMRDIIRCGLAMIVCFGSLAGIYVLAGAPLIGAAQVLVYIGAISVLILFAIMLTQTKDAPASLVFQTQAVGAAVASVILFLVITVTVAAADWPAVGQRFVTVTQELAAHLFDQYVLPFEIVSVLLLAAVIGGVFLAKREEGGPS